MQWTPEIASIGAVTMKHSGKSISIYIIDKTLKPTVSMVKIGPKMCHYIFITQLQASYSG
jgi:hypothetical protein